MPREPDIYADHDEDAAALAALIFALSAAGAVGVLAALRKPPARVHVPSGSWRGFASVVRLRDAETIIGSTWWQRAWAGVEPRAAPVAGRISRRALFRAPLDLEGEVRQRARDAIRRVQADTEAGLRSSIFDVSRDHAPQGLRRALADRIGPTEGQMGQIRRWENARRLGGMPEREIARGVRQRAAAAAHHRASVWGEATMVREVSASRTAIYRSSGRLVSSGNPLDSATRRTHGIQTRTTRGSPTPAGEPWTPAAPFLGLPPYQARCRCWIEDAGPAAVFLPTGHTRNVRIRQPLRPSRPPSHDLRKKNQAREEARYLRLRQKLQSAWVHGSRNKTSTHLQEAVRRELGVDVALWNKRAWPIEEKLISDYRPVVRRMYEETQASLPRGFVRLYRGSKSSKAALRGVVESWTDELSVARKFGKANIITIEIDTRNVFLYRGGPGWADGRYGDQREWVILGRRTQ